MDIVHNAHSVAMDNVDLAIDMNYLLNLLLQYCLNQITLEEIIEELKDEYQEPVEEYIDIFKEVALDHLIDKGKEAIQERINSDLPLNDFMQGRVEVIADLIKRYLNKEITRIEMLNIFIDDGINAFFIDFVKRNNINLDDINTIIESFAFGEFKLLGYALANELYVNFMSLMNEASMVHQQRLEIEAYCNELVEQMLEYRKEMEEAVSDYLTDHIESFQDSLHAMDQALLNNDSNGYIQSNIQLQQALGADIQYTTEEEFDALMESDEDFNF